MIDWIKAYLQRAWHVSKPVSIDEDATVVLQQRQDEIYRNTDGLFSILFMLQYIMGIIFALTLSPRSWIGETSSIHLHVWIAILLGAVIISLPLFLIYKYPGKSVTRHAIAIAQSLTGAVLIHLSGGRIETHFHIFGSLAFLAFYRDWRVLITASVITATYHLLGALFWPQSIYGAVIVSEWRWLEHVAWVVFEDIFLLYSCLKSTHDMQSIAQRQTDTNRLNKSLFEENEERKKTQAQLEHLQKQLEGRVEERTIELEKANVTVEKELEERKRLEAQLIQAQKMESIGQLAAGVAHEINNPVGFVMSNLGTLADYTQVFKKLFAYYEDLVQSLSKEAQGSEITEHLSTIQTFVKEEDVPFLLTDIGSLLKESQEGTLRVQEIVKNLKSFARLDESKYKEANIHEGIDSTLKVIWNELKYKCTIIKHYGDIPNIYCNPGQLNQVFMNLLVNAAHAIEEKGEITITTASTQKSIIITMSDNGSGIPSEKIAKIFDPFFTTKPVGKGTGLGLSISYGIIQDHGGSIEVESTVGKGTCFTIQLPVQAAPNLSSQDKVATS